MIDFSVASMEHEVRELLAEVGTDATVFFASSPVLPNFFVAWTFLPQGAASAKEAVRTVERYMDWASIPITIGACEVGENPADGWTVAARTEMRVPGEDYGDALYRLLSRIPRRHGMPSVSAGSLSVSGRFSCDLFLVPRSSGPYPGQFSELRWRCVLANFEFEDLPASAVRLALAYLAGEVDDKGRPIQF